MATTQRMADSKGRVTLGAAFAGCTVLVQELTDGAVRVMRGKTVPDPELWLHSNPKAIRMVMQGIDDARNGRLSDGPDLDEMLALADEMGG